MSMLWDNVFYTFMTGFTVLTIYDCLILYDTFDILIDDHCTSEYINPWISLIVSCITIPYHLFMLLIWFYCAERNRASSKMRGIPLFLVYYLLSIVTTFISYTSTSAVCWNFINSSSDIDDLSFIITFYTGLHIVGLAILVIFWRIIYKSTIFSRLHDFTLPIISLPVVHATPIEPISPLLTVPVSSVPTMFIISLNNGIIPG